MKVLILNGSPRVNGDTVYVINKVKERFPENTEYEQINAYTDDIKPCMDCRHCVKNIGCAINDKMDLVKRDDYDIVIIASPLYMSFVTPPLFSIFTRLNYIYCNKHFLKVLTEFKKKKGILILVGGGDGGPENAIEISKNILRKLNAEFDIEKDYIYSLNTDTIPVSEDKELDKQIDAAINHILN